MRLLFLSGSPQKKGNTARLLAHLSDLAKGAEISGLKTKQISLAGLRIKPCRSCRKCMQKGSCVLKDDFNSIARKMLRSDVIIIGSPVYFHDVSGVLKNFLDRTYSLWHEKQLRAKRFIPVAVAAESGEERTLDTLQIWAQAHEMKIIHGVSGHGYKPGEVLRDPSALKSAEQAIHELSGNHG